MRESRSSIVFKSNLQPRSGAIREDISYLQQIWDFTLLAELKRHHLPMTPVQERAYEQISVPCMYAKKGDFPFGTFRNASGLIRVRCRCINKECHLFSRCRPDIDQATFVPPEQFLMVRCDAVSPSLIQPDSAQDMGPAHVATPRNSDEIFEAFMQRIEPPDSLQLETEYAAIIWPQDLALLHRLNSIHFNRAQTDSLSSWKDEQNGESSIPWISSSFVIPNKLSQELKIPNPSLSEILAGSEPEGRYLNKNEFVQRLLQAQKERQILAFSATEQTAVTNHQASVRIIVNAGPGTGKTWTLEQFS